MIIEGLSNTWYNPTKKELKDAGITATIGFDFDSTINEMGEPLGKFVAEHLECTEDEVRGKNSEGARCFHFNKEGVSSETVSQLVHKYVLEESPSLLPTPFAAEVLTYYWVATGEPVTVITYRPKDSAAVTHKWLCENLPAQVPFNLIMLYGMQKEVVLERIGATAYVDDRYKTAQTLELLDGCLSILYKRPWNQGRRVNAGDLCIEDLRGLIPIINYLTGSHIMDWPGNIPYPNRMGYEIGVKYA